jgi:hypothetical protein
MRGDSNQHPKILLANVTICCSAAGMRANCSGIGLVFNLMQRDRHCQDVAVEDAIASRRRAVQEVPMQSAARGGWNQ